MYKLDQMRDNLINLINNDQSDKWKSLVQSATDNYGNPSEFWKQIKRLQGAPSKQYKPLIDKYINDDSSDSDFGEEEIIEVSNPQDQANLFSTQWEKIYNIHNDNIFNNNNTRRIEAWHNEIADQLVPDTIINLDKLTPDHPLLRPIELDEIKLAIKTSKPHKAPGPSNITVYQLKCLPINLIKALKIIYEAMLAAKYYAKILLQINLIFFGKPNADITNPVNFRPISLLETI